MYIKIKNIKKFLLIVTCFCLSCFNYYNYVKADDASNPSICDKSIDADCDGLTNAEEKLYGTDANNADSDGDGYSDEVEIKSGYDPLKPAPGDKIVVVDENSNSASEKLNSQPKPTDYFIEELNGFISSKGGKVTTDDVKGFADEQIAKTMGEEISIDTLPVIERAEIKILKQDYSSLSEKKQKEKQKEDSAIYLEQMLYLLISNAPVKLATKEDLDVFQEELILNLSEISDTSVDLEYFSNLGVKLEAFSEQAMQVEVPESMVDLHIKFLRIIKGVLSLDEMDIDSSDPLGRAIIFSRAGAYIELMSDFVQEDFQNFIIELNK